MTSMMQVICPSAEELGRDIEKDVKCPECNRLFKHPAALTMHKVKVHKIVQDEKDFSILHGKKKSTGLDVHYHCPITNCKYNQMIGSYFSKLSNLRQHFLKVHGEKKFCCSKCGCRFSMERLRRQHEAKCNTLYRCSKCFKIFLDKTSLHEHCKLLQHPYLFNSINATLSKVESTESKQLVNSDQFSTSVSASDKSHCELVNSPTKEKDIFVEHNYGKITADYQSSTVVKHKLPELCNNIACSDKKKSAFEHTSTSVHCTLRNSGSLGNSPIHQTPCNTSSADLSDSICSVSTSNCVPMDIPCNTSSANLSDSICSVSTSNCVPIDTSCNTSSAESDSICSVSTSNCVPIDTSCNTSADLSDSICSVSTSSYGPMVKDTNEEHFVENVCTMSNPSISNTHIIDNVVNQIDTYKRKLKLLPKKLAATPVIFAPVSVLNQNFIVLPRPRHILPKTGINNVIDVSVPINMSQSTSVAEIQTKDFNKKYSDIIVTNKWKKNEQKFSKNLSSSTQTGTQKKKHRKVAETQTTGDYILKKAMLTAKLPVMKESRGSQVSPRARLKRSLQQVQSSETQTFSSHKYSCPRKKRKKSAARCDFSTNTTFSPASSMETQTSLLYKDKISIGTGKTETYISGLDPNIQSINTGNDQRLLESISTQTSDSFLFGGQTINEHLGATQNAKIQTKLSMNMSLEECDTKDLQSLQQLGFTTQNEAETERCLLVPSHSTASHTQTVCQSTQLAMNYAINNPIGMPASSDYTAVSEKFSNVSVLNTVMPNMVSHESQTIEQADTVIRNKIAELENDLNPKPSFPSEDPVFSILNSGPSDISDVMGNICVDKSIDMISSCLQTTDQPTGVGVQTTGDHFGMQNLPNFLSTEVQTINFDNSFYNSIETQTTSDDVINELLNNMQTQTNDELWAELGFNDIQTQTSELNIHSPSQMAVNVETQTAAAFNTDSHNVEIQASLLNINSTNSHVDSADIQTQTLFDLNLTDSHTQTSWNDLMKFMNQVHD